MKRIKEKDVEVVIYEPTLQEEVFEGIRVMRELEYFKEFADIIAANRVTDELEDVKDKVYTRDIYARD